LNQNIRTVPEIFREEKVASVYIVLLQDLTLKCFYDVAKRIA
jgi:hypothetical protein